MNRKRLSMYRWAFLLILLPLALAFVITCAAAPAALVFAVCAQPIEGGWRFPSEHGGLLAYAVVMGNVTGIAGIVGADKAMRRLMEIVR
jgi:hypothetical protein